MSVISNEQDGEYEVITYASGSVVRRLSDVVQQPSGRIISKLEYMDRFDDQELADIYSAAKSIVAIEVWLDKFRLASEINLDDQRTISGIMSLEAGGLIAAGRAAEILA